MNPTRMPFGTYRDKPLQEIPTEYLENVVEQVRMRTELAQAILAELKKRRERIERDRNR